MLLDASKLVLILTVSLCVYISKLNYYSNAKP